MASEPSGQGDGRGGGLDAELDRAVPSADAEAFLIGVGGGQSGRVYVLAHNTVLLGRAPEADVHVPDPSVSARHARILNGSPGFEIEDLESTNGTYVGGQRITRVRLSNGDRVTLGNVDFTFLLDRKVDSTVAIIGPGGRWQGPETRALARMAPAVPPRALPLPSGMPGAADADEQGPSLAEMIHKIVKIYRFIRRYLLLIGLLAVFGCGVGLATVVALPPIPEATCIVKLQPQVKTNPMDPNRGIRFPGADDDDDGVHFFAGAEQNFARPDLVSETVHGLEGRDPERNRLADIVSRVKFAPVTGPGHLYRASYKDKRFGDGRPPPLIFLTKHLHTYLESEISRALHAFTAEVDFLRDQLTSVEKEMAQISDERIKYREKNADRLPEEAGLTQGSRFTLETKRSDLASQIRHLQADLDSQRRELATEGPLSQSRFQSSQTYRTALSEVNRKLTEAYAAGLADGHPEVVKLHDEKRRLEQLVNAEMQADTSEVDKKSNAGFQAIQNRIATLQAQLNAARVDLADTESKLGQIKHVVGDLPRVEEKVKQLAHTQEETTILHAQLFDRLKKAELHLSLERVSAESRYEIVSPPKMEMPGKVKTGIVRGLIGLVLGLVAAALFVAIREGRRLVTQTLATLEPAKSPP